MLLLFYFISHTTHNNGSFNYVKTNLNSLLFTFLCINFNAFLIPRHWLVNQPFTLWLPCNVFQSFLINLDLKKIYYYLGKLRKCICRFHQRGHCRQSINKGWSLEILDQQCARFLLGQFLDAASFFT